MVLKQGIIKLYQYVKEVLVASHNGRRKRRLERCQGCQEFAVIENKYKKLCKACASIASTKSWKLGIGTAPKEALRIQVKAGMSLTQIAIDVDVSQQTMVKWFKVYFDGMTFRDVRKQVLQVN